MKLSITRFYVLMFSLVLLSCSEETVTLPEDIIEELTTITEVFYINNSPEGSTTVFMLDGVMNTQINFEGGIEAIQNFTNGVMDSADYFNAQGLMTGRTTFEYDGFERLTRISAYIADTGGMTLTSITDFEYETNQINSTKTNYNLDGSIASVEDSNVFTLDANGLITRYDDVSANAFWEATYSNGNLSTIVVSGYGNKDGTGTFTYTNELATFPYQKEKFRFGSQWKTNIMLFNQVGGYSFKQLAETGENYLASYTYLDVTSQPTITLNVDYEFDNQGRLIQQTKNKLFFGIPHDRVLSYTYE